MDIGGRDFNRHSGSVERQHTYTKILHAFCVDICSSWLKRSPAGDKSGSCVKIDSNLTYMIPGATALILMPLDACCWASALVKVTIAPFVDE